MQSSDFSLHGAVDLGARQAAAQNAARAKERRAAGDTQYVIDVTEDTFNTDVVERSRTVPVIVDFWAEWCGPCKQLSPILEKLANEAAGRWILAKVDVDANQRLASAMRIQSIPLVVAVVAGQMVPLFNGAMPEAQISQGLDELFAALRQQGILPEGDGSAEDEQEQEAAADPAYAEADAALQRGDLDAADAAFQKLLDTTPNDPYAKSGLAFTELHRRVRSYDSAQVRRDAAERPGDAEAQARVADLDMAENRADDAFDRLIGTVRRTNGEEREKARLHLLKLFELLPPDDPGVVKARRALSMALF